MTPQEQMLVNAARAGDTAAFEQLYQDNHQPVYALAYEVLREQNAAAGVLRDTFAAAWENLNAMPEGEAFSRWVLQICNAQCDAYLRKSGGSSWFENAAALELLSDADPDTFRLPQPYTVQPELMARLERAVELLPDRQRRAIVLYYNNGLSLEDTAAVLSTRPEQVKSDLAYAWREIVRRLREAEREAGTELAWSGEAETKPFRFAMQALVMGTMIAGGTASVVLHHLVAAMTGSAAAAAGSAAGGSAGAGIKASSVAAGKRDALTGKSTSAAGKKTVMDGAKAAAVKGKAAAAAGKATAAGAGKAVGMSALTKALIGAAAIGVVAGGGYTAKKIIDNTKPETPPEPVVSAAPADGGSASAKSVRVLDAVTVYNAEGVQLCTESYDYDENLYVIRSHGEGDIDYGVSDSFEFEYEYDPDGRILSVEYNGNAHQSYDYDADGRVTQKTYRDYEGLQTRTNTYAYDSAGNRTQMHEISEYDGNRNEWAFDCTASPRSDGGTDIEMELTSDDPDIYPYWSESYDAKGRLIREAAEGEKSLYYHDEQGVTLQEFNFADGGGQGLPYANMNFVLIDPAGNVYHTVHLGMGGDAKKSYDSDGNLTRLDFSDGTYAEFTYREIGAEEKQPEEDPYDSYGALIEEIGGYLGQRAQDEDAKMALIELLGDVMMSDTVTPGYAFMDLDGDGVMELLIGTSGSDPYGEDDKYSSATGNIFALYTLRDGKPYSVHVSGVRYMLSLCADGTLRELSIGGAFNTNFVYYHFSKDQLVPVEMVFYDGWYTEENGLSDLPFYTASDDYEDHSQQISVEEAEAITVTGHVPAEIDYQPFPG